MLFMADSSGLRGIDISIPSQPKQVAFIKANDNINIISVEENLVYVSRTSASSPQGFIEAYDFTIPEKPIVVATHSGLSLALNWMWSPRFSPNNLMHFNGTVKNGLAYLPQRNGVAIIDMGKPDQERVEERIYQQPVITLSVMAPISFRVTSRETDTNLFGQTDTDVTRVYENDKASLIYTFHRTGSTANSLTVYYKISGTATPGADYTIRETETGEKSVTFAAGSSTTKVIIDPNPDSVYEGDETVELSLCAGRGYSVGTTPPVTGRISNSTPAILTSTTFIFLGLFSPLPIAEDASESLLYVFNRIGDITSPLSVNYTVDGSASLGIDYIGIDASPATKTVTFAANSSTAIVTVDPTIDAVIEPDETVSLTLAAGNGYTIGTTSAAIGTIVNIVSSQLPAIGLAVTQATASEDGPENIFFHFSRTGDISSALTVNFNMAGNAVFNTDYIQRGASITGSSGSITFAPGANSAILSIDPISDATSDGTQTVSICPVSTT
jgi:hypothetical protein